MAALAILTSVRPARAQFAVIDVAAVAQLVQQVQTLAQQLAANARLEENLTAVEARVQSADERLHEALAHNLALSNRVEDSLAAFANRMESSEERVLDGAGTTDGVLPHPAPDLLLVGVDTDRATFALRYWHAPDATAEVGSRVARRIQRTCEAEGTEFALAWPPPPPPLTPPGAL